MSKLIKGNSLFITPPIIAHRGASAYAPENTRAAFLKAKALGANWVEFDVQLTADGKVVVFHDENLERTSNGRGKLINHTLNDLKTIDVGSWFHSSFQDEKILTLDEVVVLLQEQQLAANIELKASLGQEQILAAAVMDILQHVTGVPLLISSFQTKAIRAIRRIHASIPLGCLLDEWTNEWQPLCDELGCLSVNISDHIATKRRIAAIRQAGYAVLVYTVNDSLHAERLFDWGVSAVFSDSMFWNEAQFSKHSS